MEPRPEHLIRLEDLSDERLDALVQRSLDLKAGRSAPSSPLTGRSIGLLFFRGSLRTRTSLEVAVHQLGGQTVHLASSSDFWNLEERDGCVMDGEAPEHVKDAAAVLSRYVDALAIRSGLGGRSWETDRRDAVIASWARHADVPVINTESALWHPLQALADLMTLRESLGELAGKKLALCWTHSPTPARFSAVHSLLHAALRAGMSIDVAHPQGFDLDDGVLSSARREAEQRGGTIATGLPLADAVSGADVVYARSWGSLEAYGNPTLAASKLSRTGRWTIDEKLMAIGRDTRLMHAMPVRRNLEVTDEVLDGPRSLLVQQAENRLHSQKAFLTELFA